MSDPVRAFPLDEENTTWRSRGYLPHLERDGAVYFVTFRLADALPQHVLAELQAERQAQMAKLRVAGRFRQRSRNGWTSWCRGVSNTIWTLERAPAI